MSITYNIKFTKIDRITNISDASKNINYKSTTETKSTNTKHNNKVPNISYKTGDYSEYNPSVSIQLANVYSGVKPLDNSTVDLSTALDYKKISNIYYDDNNNLTNSSNTPSTIGEYRRMLDLQSNIIYDNNLNNNNSDFNNDTSIYKYDYLNYETSDEYYDTTNLRYYNHYRKIQN